MHSRRLCFLLAVWITLGLVACQVESTGSQSGSTSDTLTLSIADIDRYARMANIVYEDDDAIARLLGGLGLTAVFIDELPRSEVKYFHAIDAPLGQQVVVVRGTSNPENVEVDVNIQKVRDPELDIMLHQGFRDAANELFRALQRSAVLRRDLDTVLVGHSLGGALATILGMYLSAEGFDLQWIITFGQPKVTNDDGVDAYGNLPVIRLAAENDIVVIQPPNFPPDPFNGDYVHLGLKVRIDADRLSYARVGDSSNQSDDFDLFDGQVSVLEHLMDTYLSHIAAHSDQTLTIQFAPGFSWGE